jgi:hydrogenase assembly chaperone HypC/HupF
MCLDFPGLVVARDNEGVTVETQGRRRRASTLLLPDMGVGDWVRVAAGTVIERLDTATAHEISSAIELARGATR